MNTHRPLIENRKDDPPIVKLSEKRTRPLLDYYGRHLPTVSIQTLVQSCYLQGVEDAMDATLKPS